VTFKNSIISFVNGLLLTVLILGMIIKPAFGFLILPSLLIAVLLWNSQKLVEINNE
jgi:Trk-type K+ transport system membrane component